MKSLNIGLLGLTKTSKLLVEQMLQLQKDKTVPFRLVAMADKYAEKYSLKGVAWRHDEDEIISASNIDIIVICTEGLNNAYMQARNALELGKHVVTNNQTLMAVHGQKLWRLAEDKAAHLRFEASILGSVPIVESLLNSYSGSQINRIYGVLNSTCNYIFMRMKDAGITLQEAINDAIELGYTEIDPELDISGRDSLYKLAILNAISFGEWLDVTQIKTVGLKGIEPIDIQLTQKFGRHIKLLASTTGRQITVMPTLLEEFSQLGNTNGTLTGLIIETDNAGPIFMAGHGNDKAAIASALMSDILAISHKKRPLKLRQKTGLYKENKLSRFYVRLPAGEGEHVIQANHVRVIEEQSIQSNHGSYVAYIVETGLKYEELSVFASGVDNVTNTCILHVFCE